MLRDFTPSCFNSAWSSWKALRSSPNLSLSIFFSF